MEKKLLFAIAELKKALPALKKDSTNPYYNNSYFDINSMLEVIEPLLETHGMVLTQPLFDGKVKSILTHIETGEQLISELTIPDISDPQKIGSCITYYRRYTLQSLLALRAEDDDANLASNAKPKGSNTYLTTSSSASQEDKPWLNKMDKEKNMTPQWLNVVDAVGRGEITNIGQVRAKYKVNRELAAELEEMIG